MLGAEAAGAAAEVRELRFLRAQRDVVDFLLQDEQLRAGRLPAAERARAARRGTVGRGWGHVARGDREAGDDGAEFQGGLFWGLVGWLGFMWVCRFVKGRGGPGRGGR